MASHLKKKAKRDATLEERNEDIDPDTFLFEDDDDEDDDDELPPERELEEEDEFLDDDWD
jgi:hypothetical protein